MGLDLTAIAAERDAVSTWLNTGQDIDWAWTKKYTKLKIDEAVINGGIVSYTIAGRTVTVGLDWLTKILALAESRAGGGIVTQLGEF